MIKIITVVGTRPQFIKAAAVSRALRKSDGIQEILVHTGQHYDPTLSSIFFKELSLKSPDYQLNGSAPTGNQQIAKMLPALETIYLKEKPDYVLVYGDTNSTLAGALSATDCGIPIIHVEAGLRNFDMTMPEERNRVITDRLATWLFTPSAIADEQLKKEGLHHKQCHRVGDVMYDALLTHQEKALARCELLHELECVPKQYGLVTIHRAENTNDANTLTHIVKLLNTLANDQLLVFPLHPRTKKYLQSYGLFNQLNPNIKLLDPQRYFSMILLTKHARFVLTDSGGLQKEAFYLKTPSIVLRDNTEWVELLENGWVQLLKPDQHALEKWPSILDNLIGVQEESYPYGRGDSAERIVSLLEKEHAS